MNFAIRIWGVFVKVLHQSVLSNVNCDRRACHGRNTAGNIVSSRWLNNHPSQAAQTQLSAAELVGREAQSGLCLDAALSA